MDVRECVRVESLTNNLHGTVLNFTTRTDEYVVVAVSIKVVTTDVDFTFVGAANGIGTVSFTLSPDIGLITIYMIAKPISTVGATSIRIAGIGEWLQSSCIVASFKKLNDANSFVGGNEIYI